MVMNRTLTSIVLKTLWRAGYSLSKVPSAPQGRAERIAAATAFEDAVATYKRNGYVLVRDVLPAAWMAEYRAKVEQWFEELDRRAARDDANEMVLGYKLQGGINLSPKCENQTQPPPGIRDFLAQLHSSGLWHAGFFDEEMGALIEACSIRRQRPTRPDHAFAYHQDSAVIGGEDGVVIWIPLDPLDELTPGLELVPALRRPLAHGANPLNGFLEAVEPAPGERVAVTDAGLGDVLVFHVLTPHRSLLTAAMTKTRHSIDLRAVPLSKIPAGYRGQVILMR
jgi:hypothetical protein